MALADDLEIILKATLRAINILAASQINALNVDPRDENDDTLVTLTPAQKQVIVAKMAPVLTVIKNRAAQLP